MATLYRIRSGERFVLPDGSELGGGELIQLEEDVAILHAMRVDRVEPTPADVQAETAAGPQG